MSYDIEIQERRPVGIASVRKDISQSEIAEWVQEAVDTIFSALGRAGSRPAGPMHMRYHTWADDRTECEVGFPISGAMPDDLDDSEIPGGRSARVLHVGPYPQLAQAYEAITAWIELSGETPGSAPYEVYLNDPRETAPEDLQTEVVWPLG